MNTTIMQFKRKHDKAIKMKFWIQLDINLLILTKSCQTYLMDFRYQKLAILEVHLYTIIHVYNNKINLAMKKVTSANSVKEPTSNKQHKAE
jgi:hypothetical protein